MPGNVIFIGLVLTPLPVLLAGHRHVHLDHDLSQVDVGDVGAGKPALPNGTNQEGIAAAQTNAVTCKIQPGTKCCALNFSIPLLQMMGDLRLFLHSGHSN